MTDQTSEAMQAESTTISGKRAGPIRTKRTRGPRSCLECRSAKQRCEQINFAALVPSAHPQPPHMACRRCRVLQIACIVPDQLPKSTRLRLERNQSQTSGKAIRSAQPFDSEAGPADLSISSPRSHWEPRSMTLTSSEPSNHMHTTLPTNASAFHYPSEKSPIRLYSHHVGKSVHPIPHAADSVISDPSGQQSAYYSPSSSSVSGIGGGGGGGGGGVGGSGVEIARQSSHQGSEDMIGSSPSSQPRQASMAHPRHENYIMNSLASRYSTSTPSYRSPISHVRTGAHVVEVQKEDPDPSQFTATDQIADFPWFYRARISCRPTQLLEHLFEDNTAARASKIEGARIPNLSGHPRLEDVVKHLASNQSWLANVARRMAYIQGSIPFMPNFSSLFDDVEKSSFLIGVGMYLESKILEDDLRILRDHLAYRSLCCVESPPETIYDICAIIVVANFCPIILPSKSPVGVIAGNALILAAEKGSFQLGHASAPTQLASNLDMHLASPDQVPLPPVDSTLVRNSSLWMYLSLQIDMLEMLDEPMPQPKASSGIHSSQTHAFAALHPQLSPSFQSIQIDLHGSKEQSRAILERYCKQLIDIEAPDPSSTQSNVHKQGIRPPPSPTALRCATMLMLIFASRETESVSLVMRDFIAQFYDTILITPDPANRIASLRRWTDQVIDTLGLNMARAREELKSLAIFLGNRGVVSANQLRYFELSLAALEFSSLNRLKDKMYAVGKSFFGAPKTSQEFLGALFQRPLLLKSFELSGVVRACVAKHVLTVFTTLALDLQPARRSTRSTLNVPLSSSTGAAPATMTGRSSSLYSAETKNRSGQTEPLSHWGALAHVFPLARWCGMLLCCATVLVEELAGRFMAQEAPWGASGESRLEIYHMLLRQTYDCLILFEEDAMMRHQPISQSSESMTESESIYQESEQVQIVQTTVNSMEKMLAAISTWRKKASGVGQYGGALRPIDHLDARLKEEQSHPSQHTSSHTSHHPHPFQHQQQHQNTQHPPMFSENWTGDIQSQSNTQQASQQQQQSQQQFTSIPITNETHRSMSGTPIENTSEHIRQGTIHVPAASQFASMGEGQAATMDSVLSGMPTSHQNNGMPPPQQVQFGDALLHDILFTPIEQFFDS